MEPIFNIASIPDKLSQDMIAKKIWQDNCPIPIDSLRLLTVSYYDFDNKPHSDGQIMMLDAISQQVINIFRELFAQKFPIAKIKLINEYNGDDELSMKDNNSSGFMCREITGGGKFSMHSYGVAIDINPVQNPYIKPLADKVILLPFNGGKYLNRSNIRQGMVEPVVDVFKKNGMNVWGGEWDDRIDWMHFHVSK